MTPERKSLLMLPQCLEGRKNTVDGGRHFDQSLENITFNTVLFGFDCQQQSIHTERPTLEWS